MLKNIRFVTKTSDISLSVATLLWKSTGFHDKKTAVAIDMPVDLEILNLFIRHL